MFLQQQQQSEMNALHWGPPGGVGPMNQGGPHQWDDLVRAQQQQLQQQESSAVRVHIDYYVINNFKMPTILSTDFQ